MFDFLKELLFLSISSNNVTLNVKWMILWPIIIFNIFIYWRAFKSFSFKKNLSM